MYTKTKPMFWAERLGAHMSIRTTHSRVSGAIRPHETSEQAVNRMGFRVVGRFTRDPNVPGRATAKVVHK
jgi:hypothetical protein